MVTVVEIEVESQRQGSVFPLRRLVLEGKSGKCLAQGVKLGLIVCSFQNNSFLSHKNKKYALNVVQKV